MPPVAASSSVCDPTQPPLKLRPIHLSVPCRVAEHVTFLNTFQQFGRSHFVLGMELLSVLVVLCILDRTGSVHQPRRPLPWPPPPLPNSHPLWQRVHCSHLASVDVRDHLPVGAVPLQL